MKWFVIVIMMLCFTNVLYAQQNNKSSRYRDSLELKIIWEKFKSALIRKDIKTIHSLSLKTVSCNIFEDADVNGDYKPLISIDTFLKQFYKASPKLKLWSVMRTEGYFIRIEKPYKFDLKKGKPLLFYEIWYNTIKPNEYGDGSEGMQNFFEFVKIGDRFKFSGLSSVP